MPNTSTKENRLTRFFAQSPSSRTFDGRAKDSWPACKPLACNFWEERDIVRIGKPMTETKRDYAVFTPEN